MADPPCPARSPSSGSGPCPPAPCTWRGPIFPGPPSNGSWAAPTSSTGRTSSCPRRRGAARVVTVHDLTTVRFPELCDRATLGFPRLVRRAVADGAWVHTPSRFVADEVAEEFGVDAGRVRVVYHGMPYGVARPRAGPDGPPAAPRDGPPLPAGTSSYVLAVGTVEPRKDYPGLVRAFGPVADAHPRRRAGDRRRRRLGCRRLPRRGRRVAVAPACRAARLRRRRRARCGGWPAARVLAFPRCTKASGSRPSRPWRRVCPWWRRAAGAVPEVVGDAAVLVPPGDADALAAALLAVLGDARRERPSWTRGGAVRRDSRGRRAGPDWPSCTPTPPAPVRSPMDDGSRRACSVLLVAEQLRRRVPGGIGTYVRGLLAGLGRARTTRVSSCPRSRLYASRAGGAGPDPLEVFGRRLIVSHLPGPMLTRAWDRGIVRAPEGFDLVHAVSLAVPPAAPVPWRSSPSTTWPGDTAPRTTRAAAGGGTRPRCNGRCDTRRTSWCRPSRGPRHRAGGRARARRLGDPARVGHPARPRRRRCHGVARPARRPWRVPVVGRDPRAAQEP